MRLEKKHKIKMTNHQLQIIVGNTLRYGVILAAIVVLIGGIIYLYSRTFNTPVNYSVFKGVEPDSLKHISGHRCFH